MLKLNNISFIPEGSGNKEILKDVNLEIGRREFVVITGPNGSGKSTLARIMMGIEKPTSGSILFNGEDITNLDISERAAKGIGFAFQQPVRFKGLTVRDLLSLAYGEPLDTDKACTYLVEVGLCAADYIDREVNASLSGGELKRIEIAMLIARKTPLSIFDEPEAGIDLWSFHNLIRVFEKLRDKHDGTAIIISHQERILNIADRIIMLERGSVASQGKKDELLPSLLASSDSAYRCEFYRKSDNMVN